MQGASAATQAGSVNGTKVDHHSTHRQSSRYEKITVVVGLSPHGKHRRTYRVASEVKFDSVGNTVKKLLLKSLLQVRQTADVTVVGVVHAMNRWVVD